ncbi:VirD4-like conjugal transfer protein, CD1115 family [Faecalibaculum rodentium]|jgi:type IV secretion system protein VirD4|uniref:VirD4-like conjugal transfer protein, CD1115 family n=5 Tax=Faecalibaculum rodentium TaxID=1702221 RepID=UPI00248FC782|nr:type IV secretory system conjugative DNA transfer family protein [Faecalibaculum rodentium]
MHKVKNDKKSGWTGWLLFTVGGWSGLQLGTLAAENGGKLSLDVLSQSADRIFSLTMPRVTMQTLGYGFFLGVFAWIIWETLSSRQHRNLQQHAYGSAAWNDSDYTRKIRDKDPLKNWIFTASEIVSMDMAKTGRNRNCCIIGRPGTGKSRYWLTPNILNAGDETLIVTDPKEELLKSLGQSLKMKGFDIRVLNLKSKWRSDHYNPLMYIRKVPREALMLDLEGSDSREEELKRLEEEGRNIAEDDVMSMINAIMANTKSDTIDSNTGDPFWEKAEMVFLQALFYYVFFCKPKNEQNMETVLELIRMGEPDQKGISGLNRIFDEWAARDPNNIGVKQWKHFQISAKSPKMMSTIIMTASARLAPFNMAEIRNLVTDDTMELDRIGKPIYLKDEDGRRKDGKVAYFIVTNPNDSTFNFMAALMYTQIFNMIDRNAEENGGALATPCNVWMDEFRQLGTIPRFLENWAYVRGLNCGITVILQSLSQFKKIYKDEWETGLDCCDYTLFLGSRSKETLEYMSSLLGKQTLAVMNDSRTFARQGSTSKSWQVYGRELATIDELAEMPKGYGILQMSGAKPFYSKLYELEKDPMHRFMWEPWTENRGNRDPDFRKTMEWQENHERLYDHLAEMEKPENDVRLQKLEQDLKEEMARSGLKVSFHSPQTERTVTWL